MGSSATGQIGKATFTADFFTPFYYIYSELSLIATCLRAASELQPRLVATPIFWICLS